MPALDLSPTSRQRYARVFTLLELIVVIVILGILALLALPSFMTTIHKSETAVLTQNAEAVYRNAQAAAMLGISAAGPVTRSLTIAASESMVKSSTPGHPGTVQPPTKGVVIWAQNGTDTTPGYIQSYSSSWNQCVQLTVQPTNAPPTVTSCTVQDPGSLSLMAILDPQNVGTIDGAVAPFVPGAVSWTFGSGAPQTSSYVATPPSTPPPSQVTVATQTNSVLVSAPGATADPGSDTVTVSATATAVTLSWSLSSTAPTGSYTIYRCATAGCTPVLSPAYASAPSTATSYTDTAVTQGDTYSYQISVPDSSGNTLLSNTVTVTVPKEAMLTVFAGTGTAGTPTPGPATASDLNGPTALATDSSGDVYVADEYGAFIEKVDPSGTLSVFAGTGTTGVPVAGPATSSPGINPQSIAVDPTTGDVYATTGSRQVVKITPSGTLSIFAGQNNINGASTCPTPGPATASILGSQLGELVVNSSGDVFLAIGPCNEVVEITPSGTLSVFAGNGVAGAPTPGPAAQTTINDPIHLALDPAGDLYLTDYQVGDGEILEVTPSGTLSIFKAASSSFAYSQGMAFDTSGNLYIADVNNYLVKIAPDGTMSNYAGNGAWGSPTPGPANSSAISVNGVTITSSGVIYGGDVNDNEVLKITP